MKVPEACDGGLDDLQLEATVSAKDGEDSPAEDEGEAEELEAELKECKCRA